MFLIRTLLSQGTILCIILLLVTLDVGFSTGKPTAKWYVIPLVLAGCLLECSSGGWGCWAPSARWWR